MSNDRPGQLWILSAPSGAGKTTLIHTLMSDHPTAAEALSFSVSYTTRAARSDEIDGRDYRFIDRETFEHRIADDLFLEWAVVHGQLYGTGREQVEDQLAKGRDVLLDIDVQGASQVRRCCPEARSVFILPPSSSMLEARLRRRAEDGEAQILRRLETARSEVHQVADYDYVILNAEVHRAAEALAAILIAHRQGRGRQQSRITDVLATFGSAFSGSARSSPTVESA